MNRIVLAALLCLVPVTARTQGLDSLRKVSPGLARVVPQSPIPNGFVADMAHVLTKPALDSLNVEIRAAQQNSLGDIGVAIIPDIGAYTPNEVGLAIYRTWRIGRIAKIGEEQRGLGVLMLLVPKELSPDRKGHCYITTGRGAEGPLTDAIVGTICRQVIQPEMIKRDYSAAVRAGIVAVTDRVRSQLASTANGVDSGVALTTKRVVNDPRMVAEDMKVLAMVGKVFAEIFAALFALIYAFRWKRHHRRKCPKCGRKMSLLSEKDDNAALTHSQQVEEEMKSVDYDVWQCSCGERTIVPYVKLYRDFKVCEKCHARTVKIDQHVAHQATYSSTGSAQNICTCQNCGDVTKVWVVLPILTASSSGSDSDSSSSSSSSDSFGGSGDSGGGGGGSDY
jgi:uncharacterized protein